MKARFITLLTVVCSALLVGCGAGNTATAGANSPATTTSAAGTKVTATEKEYSITLSTMTFTPGVYTFDVQNAGTMVHNLTIAGPGVTPQTSPDVKAGGSTQLTVTLEKGTYELWCSIPGHKQMGMDLKIEVK